MVKLLTFALIAFLIYSAMTLVTVRYEQRLLFAQKKSLEDETKKLETRWRFLELDRANLTNTISLDRIIKSKFKMISPNPGDVIYIDEKELALPDAAQTGTGTKEE